ncbi:iron donor protein CyaY [Halopseudomonas bauzanensis]|uniref:iron donor protein CyaY n=1 Tax=Halopseudomonas bauzanensis TaxID=653930 RepID=UPI002553AA76|nr:iron donor protein CyaY [Halopseudomonas bauzanensis]
MQELNESEFHRQVDLIQDRIEQALDAADLDLDMEQTEGALVLMLAAGPRLVIGRQPASRELWVATPDGTLHFGYQSAHGWIHDSDGEALGIVLAQVLGDLSGDEVELELDE